MSRATVVIHGPTDRERIAHWASQAPVGTRVDFKASKRTIPQNDLMWSMLTDIARQLEWHGHKLTATDWKLLFLDALKRETTLVPNLDGNGFVNISTSSSDLSKAEMSDLIEIMRAFGANHSITFIDQEAA